MTVLFADLVGFTARAEQMDPEDVDALLSGYHTRVRGELERYGGTVEKFIGDAVMAIFGAPVAHEDDPERAVRAALAVRDWAREEEGLEVRIGVNTGEALVKLEARPEVGEGMASGDVVNTAARLQAAAPTNGVLVGETTYRATETAIRYDDAEPVSAKGKAEPLAVWEAVEPRSSFGVDVVQAGAPLVGRQRELDLLAGALARARQEREPQLVTLVGVPGIGKSRLVYELSRLVHDDPELFVVWRQGRSLPYGVGVTYWALSEMVKAQAGILETDDASDVEDKLRVAIGALVEDDGEARWLEGHLRPLAGIVSETQTGSDAREERFAAWRRFLEALAERDPTVLVFEDLHWADDDLLDFVDYLVDWAAGVPLLVVGTARPELMERRSGWGGGKPNAVTLSLSPLSDDDTARLIAGLLERSVLPAEQQAELLARAGGNPLYAEQFVRMLLERGSDDLPMPETVQGIIAARLDALPEEEKTLLQSAAVLGKVFWLGAVGAIAAVEQRRAEQRLHALVRKEFVRRERRPSLAGESEYAFRHLLVQEVAYGQIPRAIRAEKHRLAAEWIESLGRPEDHAEMVAHHYLEALGLAKAAKQEVVELERAARLAARAGGDRARALNAYAHALHFYEAALELWPEDDADRGGLLLRYGEALSVREKGAGSLQALTDARDSLLAAGNDAEAAEAEILLAMAAHESGLGEESARHTRNAIEIAERLGRVRSKAFVYGWSANRFVLAGISAERGVELSREAVAVASALGESELQASALNSLGVCRIIAGDFPGAVASLEEALALAREVSPFQAVRACGNLASVLNSHGELSRARAIHEEGLALAREFGLFQSRWLWAEVSIDRYLAGEWTELAPELDAQLADESPFFMEAALRGIRAQMRLAGGNFGGAADDAERCLERGRQAVEHQVLCPAMADFAFCMLGLDRVDEAGRAAAELEAIVPVGHDPAHYWFLDLAFVMCELGRARELVELASSSRIRTRWVEAALLYAGGELDAAADALAEMGDATHEAYVRLKAGDEANVRRALDFWRSVGATRYIAQAESLLAASA